MHKSSSEKLPNIRYNHSYIINIMKAATITKGKTCTIETKVLGAIRLRV